VIVIVFANYINVEQILVIAGVPYDTLEEVIGIRGPLKFLVSITVRFL
jgi:cystathionine beta-lyase family protein involved in aluminum resistance